MKDRGSRLAARVSGLACAALLAAPAAGQGAAVQDREPRDARRETRTFFSPSLGTTKQVVVHLPPAYHAEPARRFPVVVYLHGLWGSEGDWSRQGRLPEAADSLARLGHAQAIVLMPDGDDGWWTTWNRLGTAAACQADSARREPAASYCVPWARYDEYVARDLVRWADTTFRTLPGRRHRGIAGLSMGGLGAVSLALRYPDVFAAAASHSGVLAPRLGRQGLVPARSAAELEARWGSTFWPLMWPAFGRDTLGWRARDPAVLARRLRARGGPMPALFLDAGAADLFAPHTRALARALDSLGVRATVRELPGGHDWAYWRAHGPESLAWLLARVAPAAGTRGR